VWATPLIDLADSSGCTDSCCGRESCIILLTTRAISGTYSV